MTGVTEEAARLEAVRRRAELPPETRLPSYVIASAKSYRHLWAKPVDPPQPRPRQPPTLCPTCGRSLAIGTHRVPEADGSRRCKA